MKRILLNATQTEETRVAIVDGQYLYDLDIESAAQNNRKSNIYKGTVTRVEASLEAAFVDYGADRHGFLPLKEIARSLFPEGGGKRTIQQALKEGQQLIVQVEKEERGNKGAALTTQVSLAGRYLVLMPRTEGSGGISRKVESRDRDELRQTMNGVEIPDGMSAIARTMALGRSEEELQWDLNYLQELWESITQAADSRPAPFLIYQESNIVSRTIRDHLRSDVSDIIIDDPGVYEEAVEFMQQLMPHNLDKLKLYEDAIPLFTRYQIENQIETAHQRSVNLRSGGSIVIDHTEALTSVDINSARATQGSDIEETAFRTNMEAAEEIARQLRLRDLGGLLVIDFIDMNSNRNQREVENCLRDSTRADRARIQIGKISRFGLLEMSRQRLGASLREISAITCPRCDGQGTIRTVESLALHILRLIEDEAHKERTARVNVQVPVAVATFLFNEKRDVLAELDKQLGMHALILPNPNLETPHYDIQRTRVQDLNKTLLDTASFELPTIDNQPYLEPEATRTAEPALVKPVARSTPPPAKKEKGLLAKILGSFSSEPAQPKPAKGQRKPTKQSPKERDNRSRKQENRGDSGRQDSRRSSANKQGQSGNRQNENRNTKGGQKKTDQQPNQRQSSAQNNRQADESRQSSSRRGRRGNRGKKPNNQPENKAANEQKQTTTPVTEAAQSPATPPAQSSRPIAAPADKAPVKPLAASHAESEPVSGDAPKADIPAKKTAEQKPQSSQPMARSPQPAAQTSASEQTPAQSAAIEPGAPGLSAKPKAEGTATEGRPSPLPTGSGAVSGNATAAQPPRVESRPSEPSRPVQVKPVQSETNQPEPAQPKPVQSGPVEPKQETSPATPATQRPAQPQAGTDDDGQPKKPVESPTPAAAPKKVPGQIETRPEVVQEVAPNQAEEKKPAPRPTQWTPPAETPPPGKQIETREQP
ncbi:MAG: Rne/Rng family ribonuclease [Gammaproteobacteria bacterium]